MTKSTPTPDTLEAIIGYRFSNPLLLVQSLTHRSYVNENKDSPANNERLEFLGDAVIEVWSSQLLFEEFPTVPEGQLTNLRSLLVRTENLATVAKTINLGSHLFLSRGEAAHGGRDNISLLADTFESLVGAIFLDSGFPSVYEFLNRHLKPSLTAIRQQKIFKDPKSYFQEICQSKTGFTPHYEIISQSGPDHAKIFESSVIVNTKPIATGIGISKQKAEEAAALNALEIFKTD